jgi:hypothetical protein
MEIIIIQKRAAAATPTAEAANQLFIRTIQKK